MKTLIIFISVISIFLSACGSSSSSADLPVITSGSSSASGVTSDLISLTNAYRKSKGKSALPNDPVLTEHALEKALEMAKNHVESGNLSHGGFKKAQSQGFVACAENLGYTYVGDGAGKRMFGLLDDGKGHTKNMLNSKWNAMGTAVVSRDGYLYVVQEFGTK